MRRFLNELYTPFMPLFDADGDGSGGGGEGGDGAGDDASKRTVTMTQADLDALIAREKGRAKKPYADYDELKTKVVAQEAAEEERRVAALSVTERLQADKDAADLKAKEAEDRASGTLAKANERLISSEFRLMAKEAGVMVDALGDALVLADLSAVSVNDSGDVVGVKEAVDALQAAKPYLFGSKGGKPIGDSTNPSRNTSGDLSNMNPRQMMAMGYNSKK